MAHGETESFQYRIGRQFSFEVGNPFVISPGKSYPMWSESPEISGHLVALALFSTFLCPRHCEKTQNRLVTVGKNLNYKNPKKLSVIPSHLLSTITAIFCHIKAT